MLTAFAAAAFWVGGLLRLPAALRDSERRPLCVALICIGVGAVFDVDQVYLHVDQLVGRRNISDLVAHGTGLIGVYFLLIAFDELIVNRRQRPAWPLRLALGVAVIASVVLFFATPMDVETTAFTAAYGSRPTIAAYWALSIMFPAMCLMQLLRTAVNHRRSSLFELRLGLTLVATGAVIGFVYAALKLSEVGCALVSRLDLAAAVQPLDQALLAVGLLLIASGLVATNSRVAARFRWAVSVGRARYLAIRLRWLWNLLCVQLTPVDVLDVAGADAEFRLLRRVIEIQDALAVLSSPTANLAASSRGSRALTADAERLAAIVYSSPPSSPQLPPVALSSSGLDPVAEARQLIRDARRIKKRWQQIGS